MPIRSRITGFAERAAMQRKATQLHPLLKFGSRHHSVWHTLVEAGAKGLTAYQLKQREHNYHPQILADLQKAKLVGKLAKSGNEFLYVADPRGRGVIAQEITATINFFETDDGKFLAKAVIVGQAPRHGKVVRKLGSKTVKFTIPDGDDPEVIDIEPIEFAGLLLSPEGHAMRMVNPAIRPIDEDPFQNQENVVIIEG